MTTMNLEKQTSVKQIDLPEIYLRAKADYRLKKSHLWVYSNEIDTKLTNIKDIAAGIDVIIKNVDQKVMGVGYFNPNTLISARIMRLFDNQPINVKLFIDRIKSALELRELFFTEQCYRLIYGESDFLPGLVIDRFQDIFVVQISTFGMERYLPFIIEALNKIFIDPAILLKNNGKMREIEGLASYVQWQQGTERQDAYLIENGVAFYAPIVNGQKTGWFFDHRTMRYNLSKIAKDKTILDIFCYVGAWGITAAKAGATEVTCTDLSDFAIDYVKKNAQLNNLDNVKTITGDAFDVMQSLHEKEQIFDIVVLDPPAFIPKKKDLAKGIASYRKANLQAMRLVAKNGILISSSCSMHLELDELQTAILLAANKLGRKVQILEYAGQAADHPVHPAIVETRYLKTIIAKII